jgi:hypothetical protein
MTDEGDARAKGRSWVHIVEFVGHVVSIITGLQDLSRGKIGIIEIIIFGHFVIT